MDGKQSLLQKGPKFAVSSSRVPLTKYIAVTKKVCDELGENITGKDCIEIYQKTREILQHYQKKKSHTHNTTKEEREAIKNPQGRCLSCGPHSRQGSSLGSPG